MMDYYIPKLPFQLVTLNLLLFPILCKKDYIIKYGCPNSTHKFQYPSVNKLNRINFSSNYAAEMTSGMCSRLNVIKLFQKTTAKGRIYIDEQGYEVPPYIFPFLGPGVFENISNIVMGIDTFELSRPLNNPRWILNDSNPRRGLIISIRGTRAVRLVHQLIQLHENKSHDDSLIQFDDVRIIITHTADIGFPSGVLATEHINDTNTKKYVYHMADTFSKKIPNTWKLFVSNYDDTYGLLHPVVTPIPIGLTTSVDVATNLATLCTFINTWKTKNYSYPTKWLYIGAFQRKGHNKRERLRAVNAALRLQKSANSSTDVLFTRNSSFHYTLQVYTDFKFVLAPSGRGFDTHRILEVLLMGRIPIVRWDPYVCAYQRLPVLVLRNGWDELTWHLLETFWKDFMEQSHTYDYQRMFAPYWLAQVLGEGRSDEDLVAGTGG